MLRKIRIAIAALVFTAITLLFLNVFGEASPILSFFARIQIVPAFLAMHFVIVAVLVVATLLFGRLYCSAICPLGILQDIIAWFSRLGGKKRKLRYGYSKGLPWLRPVMLVLFIVAEVAGLASFAAIIEPYSAFGRMVAGFTHPSLTSAILWTAAATFALIFFLAWKYGRAWCNTVCPVGTTLGFISKFSLFRPVIDTEKCVNCGLCGRKCKAQCIDTKNHAVDGSRCVMCFDCLENCSANAISYKPVWSIKGSGKAPASDNPAARRAFLTAAGMLAVAGHKAKADEVRKEVADKIAPILSDLVPKQAPQRATRIVPPGSVSIKHLEQHCVSCQLCVQACPNKVLRPSTDLEHFMQPESSFEKGYCRPECNRCGEVCPAGAIKPVTIEEKTGIQTGHAVWNKELCIPLVKGLDCGNCARHCPTGAITMVSAENPGFVFGETDHGHKFVHIPAIDTAKCIGCGACENLCPANPISAITVEGHEVHNNI
ncbi:MAG: 4Fe-4S dicluster domain-containing protein [Bacteroidales bacterium]|nr:4Fe-4S dicluster domain-containing protein [Candidatus Equibacterium intestinale]